jgi:hypothetical protein
LRTSTAAASKNRLRWPRWNTDRISRRLKITRTGGNTTAAMATGWVSR